MDEKTEIGRRIRAARKAKQLTLREVCEAIPGLVISTLSGYEQGTSEPPIGMLKKLADALGVSAAYLSTFDDTPLSPEERTLIASYRASDARGRDALTSVAEIQLRYSLHPPQPAPDITD